MGARKELVVAGPGTGKTTYLVSRALAPRTISVDPVGALRRRIVGHVLVLDADIPNALPALAPRLADAIAERRAVLIDVSKLMPTQRHAFAHDLGLWLRDRFRDGTLILDEAQNVLPKFQAIDNGLVEFIAKSRNYNVSVVLTYHRFQMANADVRGLVDTVRIGATMDANDVDMARRQLGLSPNETEELKALLARLSPGQWVVHERAVVG